MQIINTCKLIYLFTIFEYIFKIFFDKYNSALYEQIKICNCFFLKEKMVNHKNFIRLKKISYDSITYISVFLLKYRIHGQHIYIGIIMNVSIYNQFNVSISDISVFIGIINIEIYFTFL